MIGVGKFRLVLMLLILCLPAAARFSRHAGFSGPHFSLPGWILRVCHPRPAPRGTQRRSTHHPSEPRNALLGEQNTRDYATTSARPELVPAEAIADAAELRVLPIIENAGLVSDPAFLCTFLI